jgi:preprotein translocase subunit SecE
LTYVVDQVDDSACGNVRKPGIGAVSEFVLEMFHTAVYKRSQGRIARQLTFAAFAVLVALGAWRMSEMAPLGLMAYRVAIPGFFLMLGLWVSYRVVNVPSFADFLISVEAEMNKVSWPSRSELIRSSLVVMFTIFFLAAILFCYDLFWKWILRVLRVLS